MRELQTIQKLIYQSAPFIELAERVNALRAGESLAFHKAAGSLLGFIVAGLVEKRPRQIVVIAADRDKAEQLRDDCATLTGENSVFFFGERPMHDAAALDLSSPISQIETLQALAKGFHGIIIASPQAIAQKTPAPEKLAQSSVELEVGMEYNFQQLIERLTALGFVKQDFIESYGDFAVRGGILDVFSYTGENPLRFEFWGNSVESIREFDPLSQRSIKKIEKASIIPSLMEGSSSEEGESENSSSLFSSSLFDYLHNDALVLLDEPEFIKREFDEMQNEGIANLFTYDEIISYTENFSRILHFFLEAGKSEIGNWNSNISVNFESTSQPSFNGSVNLLIDTIKKLSSNNISVTLACDTKREAERLNELIEEAITKPEPVSSFQFPVSGDLPETKNLKPETTDTIREIENYKPSTINYKLTTGTIHSGFIFPPAKLAVLTEHELFGRLKRRGTAKRKRFKGFSQKELQQLKPGDYVVHTDRGVGMFTRLQKITVAGVEQEVMKLEYDEGGILYVNLQTLNRVQKYSSKEGYVPKLNRLGSGEWEKITSRAKKRIKDIARDLIKLYAKRKLEEGYAFNTDSHWQKEMEASFMYEDTPDQARATLEVKGDMESASPMDRLVCGDVGFGKTEVAIRAAFKAVSEGKQAAVLVPTTILAMQHYNTFLDRLSKYAVRVEHLTRFKTTKEQKTIVEGIKQGKVDIIIGTHRILSKDIGFKDLGLLIIDEEHRFGVTAKEKLRQFRASVDTLALTATPIPRTLQFSLLGARDLSIIATPPRNRLPIQTEIIPAGTDGRNAHWQIIREAIVHELHRGGQVYVVHDRVENIESIAEMVRSKTPEAKVHVAHGQMQGHELEQTMLDFLEKKYDVLVCTKIIESGLDIPSVNTIIINRADRFGMAELHQLRGRVGRSNVQAYAYLLTPPLSALPKPTLRRLQAIGEFTELGSGFNLSMRDLEIRGAGNLLGAEQSGFVADMGFEMYEQILRQAVEELKQEEFNELFKETAQGSVGRSSSGTQTVVETDIDAYIPDFYIESAVERLDFYRRLTKTTTAQELQEMRDELNDRFGEYPDVVEQLFSIVELRIAGTGAKLQKIE
ncbi:MAG: transcription-repair coupling factor, partial [Bacteroidetes bacterium]